MHNVKKWLKLQNSPTVYSMEDHLVQHAKKYEIVKIQSRPGLN